MDEIITRYLDFPDDIKVKAVTVKDENSDYNIYINSQLSADEQLAAYQHELLHIYSGHFYSDENVLRLEEEVKAYCRGAHL